VSEPVNVWDYEALAAERLEAGAHGYYAGGAGDELTLRDNVEAYRRWHLRPRMLVDVATCTTSTTVLGHEVSMPLLVAPVALQRVAHPEGELAMARAAKAVGTIMCLSTIATASPAEVAAVDGPRWFQLYVFRDEGVTRELIARVRETDYTALLLTVDAPVRGNRERDLRTRFALPPDIQVASMGRGGVTPKDIFDMITPSLTWRDLERISREAGLPVLVKGILTAEDAILSVEHGAAGIVVSNHGGRQLDGAISTARALPEVAEALSGSSTELYVDGGIRRGEHVLAALALGARAVFVGRPALWALTVGGSAGVTRLIGDLGVELEHAMRLVGVPELASLSPDLVER
jgi:isopentenyl diphosphate isomerase/L-lactate dehydrogenase-like FMN-dependent dehydrogenase